MPLRNLVATAQGRSSRKIVVMAHRDDAGIGAGAINDASGTPALVELARPYATRPLALGAKLPPPRAAELSHARLHVSTDAGAFGTSELPNSPKHWRFRV